MRVSLLWVALVLGFPTVRGVSVDDFPVSELMRERSVVLDGSPSAVAERVPADDAAVPGGRTGRKAKQAMLFAIQPDVREGRKGEAVIMLRIPEKRKITFSLRYRDGLAGDKEVSIPAGETRATIRFTAVDDSLVNLIRESRIKFFLNQTGIAEVKTRIHDDEKPPRITIDCPMDLTEARPLAKGRILLDRPADVDFKARLRFSPGDWIQDGWILVKAGRTSVPFVPKTRLDWNLTGDIDLTLTVSGTGRSSALAPVRKAVRFIDRAKFELAVKIDKNVVEGQTCTGRVRIQGKLDYPLTVNLRSDHPDLLEIPQSVTIPAGDTGRYFHPKARGASVPAVDRSVTVTASALGFADGVASVVHRETREIGHVRSMNLPAQDLVWDPQRKRIYASVLSYPFVDTGGWPAATASVLAIDPETEEVTRAVGVFSPGQLVLSKDGESLYVASGGLSVNRISLEDFTIRESYTAGHSQDGSARYIRDFVPLERQPGRVVMALIWETESKTYVGFEVRDKIGAVSPALTFSGANPLSCLIEPTSDPDVVCGFTRDALRKMRIGEDGSLVAIQSMATSYDYWIGFPDGAGQFRIRFDGRDAFRFGSGLVIRESDLQLIGRYDRRLCDTVCPDTEGNRDYFLNGDGTMPSIVAYDRTSYEGLCGTSFTQDELAYGTPLKTTLIRWGGDGLAFSTKYHLILVNNQRLVATDPAADLGVEMTSDRQSVTAGGSVTFSAKVTNHGSNNVTGGLLKIRFFSGCAIISAKSSSGTPSIEGGMVSASIPDLAAGATWTVDVTVQALSEGLIHGVAAVTSDAVDPDHSNNSARVQLAVLFDPAEKTRALDLGAIDMASDPDGARVWLSVPSDYRRQFLSTVAAVDPKTGKLLRFFPLPWNPAPGTLAVSGNGRYLFVGSNPGNEICRFDLSAESQAPHRFKAVRMTSLLALHPVDESGSVLLVSGAAANGNYTNFTTAVFDGEVMRPGVINQWLTYTPVVARVIDNRVYLLDNFIDAYAIDATGLVTLYRTSASVAGRGFAVNGKVAVSSWGDVYDLATGVRLRNMGGSHEGFPLFDGKTGRFLIADARGVSSWEPETWSLVGTHPANTGWVVRAIRWGDDGMAILADGKCHFLNWPEGLGTTSGAVRSLSSAVSSPVDTDGDGIPDVMEDLFGYSPSHPDPNPLRVAFGVKDGHGVIRMELIRRAGISPQAYGYEVSRDLVRWTRLADAEETQISRFTINGMEMEKVEVEVPSGGVSSGFFRLAVP